jgi:hypothetical protein
MEEKLAAKRRKLQIELLKAKHTHLTDNDYAFLEACFIAYVECRIEGDASSETVKKRCYKVYEEEIRGKVHKR